MSTVLAAQQQWRELKNLKHLSYAGSVALYQALCIQAHAERALQRVRSEVKGCIGYLRYRSKWSWSLQATGKRKVVKAKQKKVEKMTLQYGDPETLQQVRCC